MVGSVDPRRNNFDFLRFALASLVIYSHSYLLLHGNDHQEPLFRWSGHQETFGNIAVDGFFILSGFLITQSWTRCKGFTDYLRRRVLRIYPGFIAATFICALIVAPLAAQPNAPLLSSKQIGKLFGYSALLYPYNCPGVFETNPVTRINGSMWTVRYEFWCYMLVAGIGVLGLLRKRRAVVALFAAMLLTHTVSRLWNGTPLEWGVLERAFGALSAWPRLMTYFLSGSVFFLFREKIPHSPILAGTSLGMLVLGAMVPGGFCLTMPTFGAYLLFWLAFNHRFQLHHFARHGDYSYGIYLYSYPIQQLLLHWRGVETTPAAFFALSLPLSIAAGAASWYLVERRFIQLKKMKKPIPAPDPVTLTSPSPILMET